MQGPGIGYVIVTQGFSSHGDEGRCQRWEERDATTTTEMTGAAVFV